MKIAVIGTGYVGLVTGTCFAESGNEVTCIDKDARKIQMLKEGKLPIYEPGLQELVQRNRREGRLHFTTDLAAGAASAQIIFIAVGTPQAADGSADLSTVWAVTDALADVLKGPKTVVIKSTVPVGTNHGVVQRLAARGQTAIEVASNPEFLKEGAAIEDCMKPDRVVVGVRRPETAELLHDLYAPFLRTERPFLVMSPESAEMTKYVANAMLATKISFINEMANLCEALGADINDVRRGIGHDGRIGFQFLFPGAGYGGSCFESQETVFTLNSPTVTAEPLETLFAGPGERYRGDTVEVLVPEERRVLAFDLEHNRPTLADVKAITRRPYKGTMVELKTSMGRLLRVTADHPVILWGDGGTKTVLASEVQVGDRLLALCELPTVEPARDLNLLELLRGTELADDVHVMPTDDSFTAAYGDFARYVPADILKHAEEIKRHNRMPLRLYYHLRAEGIALPPPEKLRLYTAKGAATMLNAVIPVDADLLRLCGYYLAEGFISRDHGRAGAVRQRVGFCFAEKETEYISDLQRILRGWGLKFIERRSTNALTTLVSSRVFAWMVRDILKMGTCSSNKKLPRLAFNVSPSLRQELLRGAWSGDGSVTPVQKGRNMMLEYATVSKPLADGMVLLLQSLGIVPAIRRRMMNKSTQLAYIVRVSGYQQMLQLANIFGEKRHDYILRILNGYERHIRQRGFSWQGPVAVLPVLEVKHEHVETTVYSLETSTRTLIGSSGLVLDNCFPKDVRALVSMSKHLHVPCHIIEAVDRVNEAQKQVLVRKVRQHYGDGLRGKTLAVWGLAFKPRTDDIREAPSLVLLDALLAAGVRLRVHDPEAMDNIKAIYGDKLAYCDRPYGALEGAHGLIIVTEWQEFRNPDFEVMRRLLLERVIFDGRNLYDAKVPTSYGFTYYSIGRKSAAAE